MKTIGTVYLVGAGPGDAGLLTLRGAELLRRADVVIYDLLVNPDLLRLARPTAELICRGKAASDDELSQTEMSALMVTYAKAGNCVVRLKGGDPYVFGRGGEEAEALANAKISFEVVPGVFHFRPVGHAEPQPAHDLLQLVDRLRDRVQPAQPGADAGNRGVERRISGR